MAATTQESTAFERNATGLQTQTTSSAHAMGLQEGYSHEQWGPWKSHSLLLQQAVAELGWQEGAATLMKLFKESARSKEGHLSKDEFLEIMQRYPCCSIAFHVVFFELFDRNQDGYLNEADFLCGFLAVSPSTPHNLQHASGQLRMQFIFLYYDMNRNGRLEVAEVAKMIEHIQQLRGQPPSDALVDATALVSLYPEPFGFAAFFDAAHKRMLSGTAPLLRTQQDLPKVVWQQQRGAAPSQPAGPGPAPVSVPSLSSGPSHCLLPSAALPPSLAQLHATSGGSGSMPRHMGFSLDSWNGGHEPSSQNVALRVVRHLMESSNKSKPDICQAKQLVSPKEMLLLCDTVVEVLRQEDSLVQVPLPCRVYGDIHGQLLDLLEFFNAFSWPDKRRGDIFSMNYIFLGDFVDRGSYSCDVVTLLFSLKILYPMKVFLVRGNHEDRLMNVNYGFQSDCARIFGQDGQSIWDHCNDVFEFLPIAALVEGCILCIHGGIGNSIHSLGDLKNIPKPIQVVPEITETTTTQDRVVLDALWSDPTDSDQVLGVHTSPRGKNTCRFGPDRVSDFNRRNGLKLIIRAHECVQHGYEYFAAGQLLTVFSATNYCNQYNNDGAMVVLVKDDITGEVIEHAQVIKSGTVDTSFGWNEKQFRAPSPMRRRCEQDGGLDELWDRPTAGRLSPWATTRSAGEAPMVARMAMQPPRGFTTPNGPLCKLTGVGTVGAAAAAASLAASTHAVLSSSAGGM